MLQFKCKAISLSLFFREWAKVKSVNQMKWPAACHTNIQAQWASNCHENIQAYKSATALRRRKWPRCSSLKNGPGISEMKHIVLIRALKHIC